MIKTMMRPTIIPIGEKISRGTMGSFDDSIENFYILIGWEVEPNERNSHGKDTWSLPDKSGDISPNKRDLVAARLMSYLDLTDNWDGFGGVAPASPAVFDALDFLDQLSDKVPLPQPMLSGDGEVGLLWKSGQVYLDVGFTGNKTFSYYAEGEQGVTDENESVEMKEKLYFPIKLEQIYSQLVL